MQRIPPIISSSLIFLALLAAVGLPIVASGYSDLRRAETAQVSGDRAGAAKAYQSAAQRLPWRNDLWEQAGRSALLAGQPEQAIQFLQKVKQLSVEGRLALGDAYVQTGKLDQALTIYQALLAENGASAETYARIAGVYRTRGDVDAERTALQNELLLSADNAAAQYRLGLLLSLVNINSAMTHLQLASRLDPEYASVFQTLRITLTLADLEPTETGRLVTLGRGLALVDEWQLAARAFESAAGAEAGNAQAWAWLGEAKQHLGQDGRGDLDKALSLDGNSVVVRGLRGLYWKRQGNDRQALLEYQAAAALEPDNPAWKASLGETYARLGDLVSALAAYQRATEVAPQESTYWRLLAVFCSQYGVQVREIGLPAAQKSVDLSPDDPLALDALGTAQLSLGEFYTAGQTLLKALDKMPDFASARLHLAMVYLQTGDRSSAYDQLLRVQKLDPQGAAGQQATQMLQQYFP